MPADAADDRTNRSPNQRADRGADIYPDLRAHRCAHGRADRRAHGCAYRRADAGPVWQQRQHSKLGLDVRLRPPKRHAQQGEQELQFCPAPAARDWVLVRCDAGAHAAPDTRADARSVW